jgi:hypothetical protein
MGVRDREPVLQRRRAADVRVKPLLTTGAKQHDCGGKK